MPGSPSHIATSLGLRIDWLLRPDRNCTGLRYQLGQPDRYECDLQLPGQRGGLDDFYYLVARDLLTDDGILYVALYPQPIANYEDWPDGRFGRRCTVLPTNLVRNVASIFAHLTNKLNNTIKTAIDTANSRLGETKIMHLDVHQIYREGAHELCGVGERWMHGITPLGGKMLHPNAAGHAATAEALATLVANTHPYADEIADYYAATAVHDAALDRYLKYLEELGPVPQRSVRLSPGTSAKGWEGCSSDPCKHFVIQLEGFSQGVYTVECWAGQTPGRRWYPRNAGEVGRWTWPTSPRWTEGGCYWGFPGETVWVVVDGVKSNEVIWPA